MAFSDLLDTNQPPQVTADDQEDPGPEKRVCLPKPDVNNITVLTESLPNDPILPWHHFDSPWLEKENHETAPTEPEPPAEPEPDDGTAQQLTLQLDGAEADPSEHALEDEAANP